MSTGTTIEWTDATWNPVRGCSRVSEGCRHCYAEGVAARFSGRGQAYEGLVRIGGNGKPQGWNGEVQFVESHLRDPLKWRKPRRVFVNSMADLFHPNVTDEMRDRIYGVMWACEYLGKGDACWDGHTFQILTKRPEEARRYHSTDRRVAWAKHAITYGGGNNPDMLYDQIAQADHVHPRIWLGVSVEDQAVADKRIPELLQTPAAVRFLSMEPLLGPVKFADVVMPDGDHLDTLFNDGEDAGIDWVIVGGESGRKARPMHPDWARSVRDQCAAAGVPLFFKQWGEWAPVQNCTLEQDEGCDNGEFHVIGSDFGFVLGCLCSEGDKQGNMRRVGKKVAGHLLDGVEHHAFPEVR